MILGTVLFGLVFAQGAAQQAEPIPHFNGPTRPAEGVVVVTQGPHLFIDDYLIDAKEGLVRKAHAPERYSENPILGWEQGTTQPYVTVLRDPETGRFRMWYNRNIGPECAIACAESGDGIHWTTPDLGLPPGGNKLLPIPNGYGVSVVDDGPGCAEPSRRYKVVWWQRTPPGLAAAFSPDGIHWTPCEDNPVLPDFHEDAFIGDPRRPYGVADIVDVYWDGLRGKYRGFFKSPAVPSDGYSRGPRAGEFYRRLVTASESGDFVHWKQPWRVVIPEPRDVGQLEFYGVGGTIQRGGLLIGFPRMLHDDFNCEPGGDGEGIGYATLVTSRDGVHWERHNEIFFDRSPYPGAWDRAMTWIGSVVPVGDRFYLYYGGYKRGHKIEARTERQLGLAFMPRDRFLSRAAEGAEPGRLVTVPLRLEHAKDKMLTLNVAASGGVVRVKLLSEGSVDIPGAGSGEVEPVIGNHVAFPVPSLNLSLVEGKSFRLAFEITNAELFGFDFGPR